jgi:predicted nucleic acid-binding protein
LTFEEEPELICKYAAFQQVGDQESVGVVCRKNVDWTDAFIAAGMEAGNRMEIYSYDRHFDKFPEI